MRYAGRRVEWIGSQVRSTGTVVRKEGNWLRVAVDAKSGGKGYEMLILPHRVRFMEEGAK